jgi:hypothetical protein
MLVQQIQIIETTEIEVTVFASAVCMGHGLVTPLDLNSSYKKGFNWCIGSTKVALM